MEELKDQRARDGKPEMLLLQKERTMKTTM